MNQTTPDRRFSLPPWPLIVVQVAWLWASIGFAFFAVLWRSTSHAAMMFFSLLLLVGISFRWRTALWASAILYAATIGANVARIINGDRLPPVLAASLAVGVGVLVSHQVAASFSWFRFQNPRRLRFRFWLMAAIVCVGGEFAYVILFPGVT